ncbi:MAG: hypothetical protein QOC62_5308 [Mycobacterium sp.]|jgi:uncharacterized protein YlxW (UPF0749 family)|nr:hypothetical protein [Mycobacterium sp.]
MNSVTDADRALGGYEPHAGLNAHEAGQPQFNPVPSLLRSLLSEHLDPGYAAAAAKRAAGNPPRARRAAWAWQAAAALLIALVFAAAVAQARSTAPGVKETQQVLVSSVRSSQAGANALAAQRGGLTAEVDNLRRSQLEGDAEGQRLLQQLDRLAFAGALTKVTGPGVTVTLTDPGVSPDLSDVSKERIPGSRQAVLDRDLQLVVNSLWASGAEATAVGGVRIGPNVTIRQAGGAILVDNQPISSPYVVNAVGPPHAMQDAFERSPGFQRMRLLEASYGVTATVDTHDSLTVSAGGGREVKYAKPIGDR